MPSAAPRVCTRLRATELHLSNRRRRDTGSTPAACTCCSSAHSANADGSEAAGRTLIVGGGPAGVMAAASLAHAGVHCVVVDASGFDVGRLSRFATADVPANTKLVNLVAQLESATQVVHGQDARAALEKLRHSGRPMPLLEPYDPADPLGWCSIEGLIGPLRAVTQGLRRSPYVSCVPGVVEGLLLNTETMMWTAYGTRTAEEGGDKFELTGCALVLGTGAEPRSFSLPSLDERAPGPSVIDMETAFDKQRLAALLGMLPTSAESAVRRPAGGSKVVVGVIGNSHSGAIILENLRSLCEEQADHCEMMGIGAQIQEVRLVARSGCRLAVWDAPGQEYRFTNTGLKGRAATFARRYLTLEREDLRGDIQREPWPELRERLIARTSAASNGLLPDAVVGCTHLIQAVGYEPLPLPPLSVDGKPVPSEVWRPASLQPRETLLEFGSPTLRLELDCIAQAERPLLLFGSGIAFPESLDHHPKYINGGEPGFLGEGPVGISPMLKRAANIARIVTEAVALKRNSLRLK